VSEVINKDSGFAHDIFKVDCITYGLALHCYIGRLKARLWALMSRSVH